MQILSPERTPGVRRPLRPDAWVDDWPGPLDPNGQASIWYERPGSTVTSDTSGVKMPTVRRSTRSSRIERDRRPLRLPTRPSGSGDGPHRVEAHDDRGPRIHRQLVSDVAAAEELAEQRSLPLGQAHEDAMLAEIDCRDVILAAVDPEPPAELVHRHVWPALDEPTEL